MVGVADRRHGPKAQVLVPVDHLPYALEVLRRGVERVIDENLDGAEAEIVEWLDLASDCAKVVGRICRRRHARLRVLLVALWPRVHPEHRSFRAFVCGQKRFVEVLDLVIQTVHDTVDAQDHEAVTRHDQAFVFHDVVDERPQRIELVMGHDEVDLPLPVEELPHLLNFAVVLHHFGAELDAIRLLGAFPVLVQITPQAYLNVVLFVLMDQPGVDPGFELVRHPAVRHGFVCDGLQLGVLLPTNLDVVDRESRAHEDVPVSKRVGQSVEQGHILVLHEPMARLLGGPLRVAQAAEHDENHRAHAKPSFRAAPDSTKKVPACVPAANVGIRTHRLSLKAISRRAR